MKKLYLSLAVAVVILFLARWRIEGTLVWNYPPVNSLVVTEHYSTDLACLMTGSHRMAADIGYIQFLQYYGVPAYVHEEEDRGDPSTHDHDHAHVEDRSVLAYPRLFEFGRRIVRLDPFFNAAILEVAGSLAFNQKRTDESLQLLREAIELDPKFYRYRLYAAAILFKIEGKDEGLIRVLAEAVQFNDCPPLLKNILGNLYMKYGYYEAAVSIYYNMWTQSANPGDVDTARRKLLELLTDHPELRSGVSFPL